MRQRDYVYQISLTNPAQKIVEKLVDRGLYGTTCAEVVRRLVEASLIQFTRPQPIKAEDQLNDLKNQFFRCIEADERRQS